ncbi:coniferyl alcohol acyltransferase-like [Hevea brasiliensis]|uniref:coniferyl alcohol acyltransferase-like n=1 Tax=Hevea brasiliensis TaxID=3981 RepID=UPI0025F37577|nr:coniferyl alcohol acyltransferase-like [Hevea brasiliensis]
MGSGGEANFTVTVIRKEVVAAVLPLQEHWLPLSNLDLLLPPLDVGVFLCYKSQKDINSGRADFGLHLQSSRINKRWVTM